MPRPPQALLKLPREILEVIISYIEKPHDLLYFALVSRVCAHLTIPWHIEYRVIRVRALMHPMWSHLALRSDLAKNVRVLRIGFIDHTIPEQFPKTLVDLSGYVAQLVFSTSISLSASSSPYIGANIDEQTGIRNICLALEHMKRLRSFVWECGKSTPGGPSVDPVHEEMVLHTISRVPYLQHLKLGEDFKKRTRDAPFILKAPHPVFSIHGLDSLSLCGNTWTTRLDHSSLLEMLQHSLSTIKELDFSVDLVPPLAECHFPHLKRLALHSTLSTEHYQPDVFSFLTSHPTIEELQWLPRQFLSPTTTPDKGFLPELQCLESNVHFMNIFEANTSLSSISVRPIERLYLHNTHLSSILTSPVLDPAHLQRVRVTSFVTSDFLKRMAERFTGITWLALSGIYQSEFPGGPLVRIKLSEYLTLLSLFPNLETFRGWAIWIDEPGDYNKEDYIHEVIMEVVRCCPNLKKFDHYRDGFEVRIFREGETEKGTGHDRELTTKGVRYMVQKCPLKMDPFDMNSKFR